MAFGTIKKSFTIPDLDGSMLAYDGRFFYLANYYGATAYWDHIFLLDSQWRVLKDLGKPNIDSMHYVTGVDAVGSHLYLLIEADGTAGEIAKLLICDRALNILKEYELEMVLADGVIVRDSFIHIINYSDFTLETYSRNMVLLKSWDISLDDAEDIAFDGRHLYISEGWGDQKIGKFDLEGNLLKSVDLGVKTWGITFDGNDLYVCRYDDGIVHKVSRV